MPKPEIGDLFKEAAEIASAVPDSLQETAFSRALDVLLEQHGLASTPRVTPESESQEPRSAARKSPAKKATRKKTPRKKSKATPRQLKDLNLRPEDGQSFEDFVKEKRPSSNYERNLASVYFLREVLGIERVTVDHVYSCFRDRNWPIPKNLANSLAVTAHQKAWLDTSDMDDISLAVPGENYVRFDLPRATEGHS